MSDDILKTLGITKDEMQTRIINRAVQELLARGSLDDGDEFETGVVARKLDELLTQRIEEKVGELADKHVFPQLDMYIEQLTLQKTNEWGEAKGKKTTFIEYLVEHANEYMLEAVDYEGKSRHETRRSGSSFREAGTRISYAIDKHLQYSIETAMEEALSDVNSQLAEGIAKACKIKIKELTETLKVKVETK